MNPIYYRNRIDIITSILEIANGNEVKQVEILVKANITHTMFKEYLFHLFQFWFNRIYAISKNV